MSEFRMPSLGSDMEDGTLLEWKVKPGDQVHRGDIVAVVDTQKGAIDVEIFEDGEIAEIVVPEGQKVPVGAVLAHVKSKGGEAAPPAAAPAAKPKPAAPAPAPAPSATFTPPAPPGRSHRISPAARRRARELNIDPETITGSGPGGSVTSEDIEAAAGGTSKASAAKARSPGAEMRRAIGAAMARSKKEIPHYYLAGQVDLGELSAWLEKENAARAVTERMIMGVLFIKAAALALRDMPQFNGFWKDGAFEPARGIHPGIAISLRGGGLVVPALHDADEKDLGTLMRDFQDLVQRARTARLKSSELADGTITITSLGERGVDSVFPIIYPPQVAIVGFGSVLERPWCVDGRVTARPVVTISLGADHRVTDGHLGGLFVRTIQKHLLEIPGK